MSSPPSRGVALLNAAGPFQDADAPAFDANAPLPWYNGLKDAAMDVGKRVVLFFAFQRAKQPERIKEVLEMVYSSNDTIDEDLVDSIVVPASDPKAAEVCHQQPYTLFQQVSCAYSNNPLPWSHTTRPTQRACDMPPTFKTHISHGNTSHVAVTDQGSSSTSTTTKTALHQHHTIWLIVRHTICIACT
jgi:hypothetical protein